MANAVAILKTLSFEDSIDVACQSRAPAGDRLGRRPIDNGIAHRGPRRGLVFECFHGRIGGERGIDMTARRHNEESRSDRACFTSHHAPRV